MKKSLFALIATVVAFAMFAACSDDSGVDNGGGTASLNKELQKSSDYEVGKGSCSGGHLAKRTEWGEDSVDFVMNEDGSAVFFLNMMFLNIIQIMIAVPCIIAFVLPIIR